MSGSRQSVAVIGSGIAGLTSAFLLQRRYDVTLFEADNRLGGHAHTHEVLAPDGSLLDLDTGFLVFNDVTYPLFARLLGEIGVDTTPTEMGMSIRCDGCGLVYAGGRGLRGLLAKPGKSLRPRFVRMMREVFRFQRHARRVLADGLDTQSLGEFLAAGGYSNDVQAHYVLPIVSAVWSTSPSNARGFPAEYLFRFLDHHGMLSVRPKLRWQTIPGGARRYVERLAKDLHAVHLDRPVKCVTRYPDFVELQDDALQGHRFDGVVLATHADTALALLTRPTREERSVLSAFNYSVNDTVLHTDSSVLPDSPGARVSWNYLLPSCRSDHREVIVSYYLNRLQHVHSSTDYVVSLNSGSHIDADAVVSRMRYHHPVYTESSVEAQTRLPSLNRDRTAFAGAYHGWGFHEDGCRSGVSAAAHFGVQW